MPKASEEIFQQKTDFKEVVIKILTYKYYFLGIVFLAMIVAFIINKYSDRKFSNWTSILIRQDNQNSLMSSGNEMMGNFNLFGGIQNVENELSVLSSYSVINKAIQELNLETTYILKKDYFP